MGGEPFDERLFNEVMAERARQRDAHELCAHGLGLCYAEGPVLTEGDIIRSKPKPKRKPRRPKKGKR
jgi:hypothetical protein